MKKALARVPEKARIGEIITIKTMIRHKMDTGLVRDAKTGKIIPRRIINSFSASFNGEEVGGATIHPGTSADPYLAFDFKVPGAGVMELTWTEDGGKVFTLKKTISIA